MQIQRSFFVQKSHKHLLGIRIRNKRNGIVLGPASRTLTNLVERGIGVGEPKGGIIRAVVGGVKFAKKKLDPAL
jgi:hypothetical protein